MNFILISKFCLSFIATLFLFSNFLDDSFLLFLNFLFVIFSLAFFVRDLLNNFIQDDINNLYSKYVYYYSLNIQYLNSLRTILLSQCNKLQLLLINFYFCIYFFYKFNFVNLLLNSYFFNLEKIESFLFLFFENEILLKRLSVDSILSDSLVDLESSLFETLAIGGEEEYN